MVKYKKIDAKTVLKIVAQALEEHLPDYLPDTIKNAELNLSFDKDHSVNIYLIEPEKKENLS